MTSPTPESFFAEPSDPELLVPRDQWGRPLIAPLDGGKPVGYHRASSFGKLLDDTYHLDLWVQRQTAYGMALTPELVTRALAVGSPDEVKLTSERQYKQRRAALDVIVEQAQEAAGSNVKSALGTAIHGATELVDKGESLDGLDPLLRERAEAYWRFCRSEAIEITSIETFGVDDVHRVAGTWDRTGWWRASHRVIDVKTGSSMDFAGIVYAVQLAEYAHMQEYDLATGERTPHDGIDLAEALIVHVPREMGAPVEAFTVDIEVGWRHAILVDAVTRARKEGKKAIRFHEPMDDIGYQILNAQSYEALIAIHASSDGQWTGEHSRLATAQRARWS